MQTAVLTANQLLLVLPLLLLDGASWLQAVPLTERQALASLAIKAQAHGRAIGLVFFGVTCLVNGWLIARSGFLPPLPALVGELSLALWLAVRGVNVAPSPHRAGC